MTGGGAPLLEKQIPGEAVFAAVFERLADIKDTALVGLDANVLLLPYEFKAASHQEIESVYKLLAEEKGLVVPAQAAEEFAIHRSAKLGQLTKALKDQSSRISSPPGRIRFLESDSGYDKILRLYAEVDKLKEQIGKEVKKIVRRFRDDVGNDLVSLLYREVFADAVVDMQLDPQAFEAKLKARFTAKMPPGFKDANKPDGGRGDLIIWQTILEIGRDRGAHFIFVTGDEKQDWYSQADGPFQPRPELLYEYWKESGKKSLHLVSLSDLLALFNASEATVGAAQQAEKHQRVLSRKYDKGMIDAGLPNVRKAVNILFRDWGGVVPLGLVLPVQYDWYHIESFLALLSEEELEGLAVGKLEVINKILDRYPVECDYAWNAIAEVFEQYIGERTSH